MRVTSQNYLHTTTYINMSMSYKYLGNSLLNKLQRKDTPETKKPFRVSRYFEEETGRTLPKFYQVPSSSSISQYKPAQSPKLAHHFSQNKIFNKLAVELETIQQNIGNRQNRKRKLSFARQKLLTEASVDPKKTIYNKILEQINQIKVKNRLKSSTSDILSQVSSGDFSRAKQSRVCQDEKTLFYGVDEIDRVLYKIKIKLSKSYYRLYAKNKNSKIMMELSYNEYMKLHFGELKGNPCNILPMLKIKNNQLTLVLRNSLDRSRAKSFKSYLGFY